ncbi:MAG: exodeoxyribonuclease VII small subunit [Alphaproteobacteria bacterium]|nr:exodeoxyribonuclease VII small subunit [Alphaproteobacteria bacterium]
MTETINSATTAPASTAELSFEEALADLQRTVEQLEKGQVPLADAVSLFERGMQLKQRCESRLAEAKARIDQLVITGDGTLTANPFNPGD